MTNERKSNERGEVPRAWTERQRQVLDLLAKGRTNAEIAAVGMAEHPQYWANDYLVTIDAFAGRIDSGVDSARAPGRRGSHDR